MKKKLVIFTGAGISAKSGIATFKDSNGLWEGHDVMEVASPRGWEKDKKVVLEFYNQRRRQALSALPNPAHLALVKLESYFDVSVITQNVDNLHEKAGSANIIHLHGELFKSQSTADPSLIYELDHWQLNIGDQCEKGSQLRPFIVWFGEMVPMMEPAIAAAQQADVFAVIGTSLQVYPAAGLIQYTPSACLKYIIDVKIPEIDYIKDLRSIEATASQGTQIMTKELIEKYIDS